MAREKRLANLFFVKGGGRMEGTFSASGVRQILRGTSCGGAAFRNRAIPQEPAVLQ